MNQLTHLEVRGAPAYYACHEGVLDELETLLRNNLLSKCLVIHGEHSWKAAQPFFPTLQTVKLGFERYHGECSKAEVTRIAQLVTARSYEAIIGVGGGKVLDLAKAVAHQTNTEAILIPTLAATCSAWTPLSVFYNELGQFTHYELFPKSTLMVLLEPRMILHSPVRYLRAGIADTLAKWYEADILVRGLDNLPLVVKIAHQAAKLCQIILLENGPQALEDLQSNTLSKELLQVMETNIVAGGMVGGFGDRYGRIAAAHSIHNGLTIIPSTHHLLHGEKVAYGILVQLALEENWDEIASLIPTYVKLQLPITIEEIGIAETDFASVATRALAPNESIHFVEQDWKATHVIKAMKDLNDYVYPLLNA